jgi:hypothetical protein
MKIKAVFISILFFLSVLIAGCLTPDLPPEPEVVSIGSGAPKNLPSGDGINRYIEFPNVAYSMPPPFSREELEKHSDLIVYATVKDLKSEWNTDDGKIPQEIQDKLNAGVVLHPYDIHTTIDEVLWTPPYDIRTWAIVTVNSWAKGNSSEEITIML